MFDRFMKKFIGLFPQWIQKIYYKYENIWLYILFGGLTTVVSVLTQYGMIALDAGTALSTTVSWIFAATFAFFVNKFCVFKSVTDTKKAFLSEAAQFYGARLVSYFLELGFNVLTVDVLGLNAYVMKLVAQVFVLVINYLFSKLVIFRKKKSTVPEDNVENRDGSEE